MSDISGISAIAEALPSSSLTTLKYTSAQVLTLVFSAPRRFELVLNSVWLRSVDGHLLLTDELKGIKPVEAIDLSGKELGVASAIIIAACIKDNPVLKELKCAATALCHHLFTAL